MLVSSVFCRIARRAGAFSLHTPLLAALSVLCLLVAPSARAEDFPAWAYTRTPAPPAGGFEATIRKQLPGSAQSLTQAQIEDDFNPPDWFPGDHPPMPRVVSNGRLPAVKACSKCHITNGAGHPESSSLAGLPVAYIQHQMAAMKSGERKGARAASMMAIAAAISDDEVQEAARYYAALPAVAFTRVVESATAPASRVGTGGMRLPVEGAPDEPLGPRIIELPQQADRMELRDSRVGFVAYVPIGSIARGEALVNAPGTDKAPACATCHGESLRGAGDIPGIAGRSAIYVFRQLNDIKHGTRTGADVEPMKAVVTGLDEDAMLAIAAYVTSRAP